MSDVFYDYSTFEDKRTEDILKSWDGLGGYHGLLIKRCARLFGVSNISVLDVGCGLAHLYEAIKIQRGNFTYSGIEKDPRILKMVQSRYPGLELRLGDVYNLSACGQFEVVYAIGLYREEPNSQLGLKQMLAHTTQYLVVTYFAKKKGRVPELLNLEGTSCEFIEHDIDERLEIVRLWVHR